jgi:peptide-methionine (S)-S-oxide reductase
VVRTRVGYTGGSSADPTYESIGDHSEAIEVEFDPAVIGYRELLAVFWEAHDPSHRSISRQYRAAIFWSGEGQRRLAESSRDEIARRAVRGVVTALEPLRRFYPAEDYHQKYYLRSVASIAAAFRRAYPDEVAFAASTAAARVNGYLGGHGDPARLQAEIGALGLTGEARETLERIVGQMHPTERCDVAR